MISKFEKKAFHWFLKLVETNPLIYNTLHFDQYSPLFICSNICLAMKFGTKITSNRLKLL